MKKYLLMILMLSLFLASCSKKAKIDDNSNNEPSQVEPSGDTDDTDDPTDDGEGKINNGGSYDEGGNDTWIQL